MFSPLRRSFLFLALATGIATAPTAFAGGNELRELFKKASDSIQDLRDSTNEVVEAKKRYQDQLGSLRDAARDLIRVFGNKEAPKPQPKPSSVESLKLRIPTPPAGKPSIFESLVLEPKAKKVVRRPVRHERAARRAPVVASVPQPLFKLQTPTPEPTGRLASLLIKKDPVEKTVDVRRLDPEGTSLYDSLSFSD